MDPNSSPKAPGPYAVVGFSFKMPGEAVSESGLWNMLEKAENVMTSWPEDRASVNLAGKDEPKRTNNLLAQGAHFMKEDPGAFDAPFFSVPAKEAETIDPQQRLALEASYHAFENAGIPIESVRGSRIAVMGASMSTDWARMNSKDPDTMPRQSATSVASSLLANRISWHFDFRGPSVYMDTACSSGMIALDQACQAMSSGDASAALVVATNILITPESSIILSNLNFLSPDSRCFSFDSRANGYARGEGIVAIVIKPLHDALEAGDIIRAVIRGTASNQDGRTPGLTQPSAEAQEALMRHTYAKAQLPLTETRYVEAHGTGTPTGDPIESRAIGKVFGEHRSPQDPILIGSIKSNIGHLEGASGLAGLMKAILIVERGIVPPNALFEKWNPDIESERYNLHVPTRNITWPHSGLRRVSVNSFGFGGANAHVILDDALHYLKSHGLEGHHHSVDLSVADKSTINGTTDSTLLRRDTLNGTSNREIQGPPPPTLLVWSAADAAAVQRMIESYETYYRAHISGERNKLEQLAFTLAKRRSVMPWRTFTVLDDRDISTKEDSPFLPTEKPTRVTVEKTDLTFAFTGQGAQYAGMGLELQRYPVFEQSLKDSDAIFASLGCNWSLFAELGNKENINKPEFSQPLCTALQIALVDLLQSFNIIPASVVGHSSGEIAAAYAAGALSHESACKIAYYRGQLAGRLRDTTKIPGAMLSANLPEEGVPEYLDKLGLSSKIDGVCIACMNSPTNVTLSGPASAIELIKQDLDQKGVFSQVIKTGIAYHSPAMREVSQEYLDLLKFLDGRTENPSRGILMASSVSGKLTDLEPLATPQYWVDNLVSPVRFVQALQVLNGPLDKYPDAQLSNSIEDVIEIGPHAALKRPITDSVPSVHYHSVLKRSHPPLVTTLNLVGELFCRGYPASVVAANGQPHSNLPFLVDCPPYPFDRSRLYWDESRISKGFRSREYSPGFLLGVRSIDWNPLQPRWRNWLSVETMPWLRDHVVDGITLCPGAGMIAMAIEATMDIDLATNRTISGFVVKNAQFIAPIRISESALDAIETEVHLRQIQTADEKRPSWSEVTIFTHHGDHWTECFRTHVQTQYEESTAKTPDRDTEQENEHIRDHVQQTQVACKDSIQAPAFYKFCKEHGLNYGESFQLLEEIAWDREVSSTASISMSRLPAQSHRSPVHPAVLDSIFHMLLAQTSSGLQRSDSPTMVPRQLTKAWISAAPWQQATSSVHLASHAQRDVSSNSSPGIRGAIYGVSDEKTPLCIIENLSMVEISGSIQLQHDQTPDRTLLYNIAWKPKLSFLGARDLQSILQRSFKPFDDTIMEIYCPKITHALRTAAGKVLKKVSESQIRRGPGHLRKFREALKYQHNLQVQEGRNKDLSNSDLESLLVECESQNPEWFFFPAVARALPELLRGETDSVELMFATRSGEKFYENVFARHMRDGRLQAFLDLATHENPGMKILEVGAGTGGFTSQLMAAFTEFEAKTGSAAFDTYTFTDISASFFDGARGRFSDYLDRMDFRVLDLEKDPEEAGFSPASHDVIFAGSVLHATSNLTRSLATLRKLLKPGGYLVIQEPTAPDNAWVNIGFGSVPGWWLAEEDWRQGTPLVDIEGWDRLLRQTGFSGVDVALKDTENPVVHFSSVLLSRATSEPISQEQNGLVNGHADNQKITILLDRDSKAQQELAVELEKSCAVSKIIDFASINEEDLALLSDVVVSLIEVGSPRLVDLSESELQAIQGLIQSLSNMLWISAPVVENENAVHDPSFAATTGLLRGLRSEYRDKHIVSLSVESPTPQPLASIISDLLRDCFKKESPSSDIEFVVRDGQVVIGRLVQEKQFDEERLARVQPQLKDEVWKTGPALMLTTEVPGMLETLRWVEDTSRCDNLAPGDVEIEATVWPLSFRDIFIALAKLGNEGLGFECGGIVTRVGAECSGEFQPGDRVVMGVVGSIRSHPRAAKQVVHKIPDGVSLEDVVAAMTPAMTAWRSLVDIARLQSGEKILIHSAAGGTGQMAVEVAKSVGAEIFATVGTEDKRELLKSKFGIPDDHIFYSRNTSFAQGIQRVTRGYGVDVVLNSIAGDGLTASWECIAPYGRFIEIGKADIRANSSLSMGHFAKNASFAGVDLYHITQTNQKMTSQLMGKVIELISEGTIRAPQPLHAYSLSDTENAFRYMQSGKNTGRILLIKGDDDIVSKRIVHKSTWRFDPDSSYVIAGGLGGLGRCILQWMADKGAKHLIVLSRSGASSKAASDVVQALRSRGVSITTPPCDVSSREKLQAVLEECAATMPPIKGCINAAMALQDAIFENMTHAQWKTTIQSKILSSWNLHELLPRDINFFILLSSLAGIYGTMAQSNYCSGCTYQDALARMRHSLGLGVSVSLDLGWMADVGIISERVEYQRNREATSDMAPVQGADLLAVLDHYCDPALPTSQSGVEVEEQCQLLLGALTPLDFDLKAGEEAPSSLQRPLFQGFKVMQERAQRVSTLTGGEAAQKEAQTPAMKFHAASSHKDRCEIVVDALKGRIARSLGVEQDDVVAEKTLSDYGVDSLMAVELRNWIRNDFGSAVTVFDIMGGASITAVGELVAAKADVAEAEAA